jgi:uncharacterized damage-inducible protein DinB
VINRRTADLQCRYKAWADKLTFEAVLALPPGEAGKERPTLFKSMIGTLNHNLVVDLIWRANLEGRAHGFTKRNGVLHPDLDVLWREQQVMNDWLLAWSGAQTDDSLDEIVRFTFVSGEPGEMTRGEILMHLVNHATYHRGWVSDLFFQLPAKPPTTDLSVYLTDVAPGAR